MHKALTMLAVGDPILDGPQPDSTFALAAPVLSGVKYYKEKAIFNGLGHFVVSKRPRNVATNPPWAVRQFVEKHKELLGSYVEPDPEYPKHPYHPEILQI